MRDAPAGIVPMIAARTEHNQMLVRAGQQRRIGIVRPRTVESERAADPHNVVDLGLELRGHPKLYIGTPATITSAAISSSISVSLSASVSFMKGSRPSGVAG